MRVVVATHGHCFDGLASAVVFTRLLSELSASDAEFSYRGCGYGHGQAKASPELLSGDENAILDFRLTPSESVSWFFDHHRTALQIPGAAEYYAAGRDRRRMFVDPGCSSCTKLITRVARDEFGLHDPHLDPLVDWADRIDGARFDGPEQAIDQTDPIQRLVSVVEHHGDDGFLTKLVPDLLHRPLIEVATARDIRDRYRPIGKRRQRFFDLLRQRCQPRGRVVFADLSEGQLDSSGKFMTYALYPESTYSVMVGRLGKGAKVLIGYNPWCAKPRDVDLSEICARHGGGGHPYVGAIPFRAEDLPVARSLADAIARELGG